MAGTYVGDIFIPESISDIVVQNALFGNIQLLRTPYVTDLKASGTPAAVKGDTLTLLTREFKSGDSAAKDLVETMVRDSKTSAATHGVKIGNYTESIVEKTIPMEFEEYAIQDAAMMGDVEGWMAEVVAQASGEYIQDELITAGKTTTLEYDATLTGTPTLSVDGILAAKMLWGDKAFANGRPGLFVSSKQWTDLAKSEDFKTLGTAATTALVTAQESADGVQAIVHGVAIYVLDAIAANGTSPETYTGLMLKPGALGLLVKTLKTRPGHRFVGTSVWQIDTDFRFWKTLFRYSPKRAIKVKTQ